MQLKAAEGGDVAVCSYGDGCEAYSQRVSRARKTYNCEECVRKITPGDLYVYTFFVYEGEPGNVRQHLACAVLSKVLGDMLCGGEYASGQMEEHIREAGIVVGGSWALEDEHVTLATDQRERVREFILAEIAVPA